MAALKRLLKGASVTNAAWLSRGDELLDCLYIVDDLAHARSPFPKELPWPVLLLYGTYSRKHLFIKDEPVHMRVVRKAATDLCTKIKWWRHISQIKNRGGDRTDRKSVPLLSRPPRLFDGRVDPVIDGVCSSLHDALQRHGKNSQKSE